MSKRKKIFHKPTENIPTKEDIFNYLNEVDSSVKSPAPQNDFPKGGFASSVKKESFESEVSSNDDFKENEQDKVLQFPKPFLEELSISKKASNADFNNNKKQHEFEKGMLSNTFVSDAVDGYALVTDKSKANAFINDINTSILKQTGRNKNNVNLFKIAALVIMVCMISGISFYLFKQIKEPIISNEASKLDKPVAALSSDTIVIKDTNQALALDAKIETEISKGEDKNVNSINPILTDGIYSKPDDHSIPGSIDEVNNNLGKATDGFGDLDQIAEKSESPQGKVQEQDNVISLSATDDELVSNKSYKEIESKKKDSPAVSKKERSKSESNSSPSFYDAGSNTKSKVINKPIGKFEEGKILFNKGKFKDAKLIFDELEITNSSNMELIYFAGVSNYNLKLYNESQRQLLKITPTNEHYYDALWYLSLVYKSNGNIDKARVVWQELSKSNSLYKDKADKYLLESFK